MRASAGLAPSCVILCFCACHSRQHTLGHASGYGETQLKPTQDCNCWQSGRSAGIERSQVACLWFLKLFPTPHPIRLNNWEKAVQQGSHGNSLGAQHMNREKDFGDELKKVVFGLSPRHTWAYALFAPQTLWLKLHDCNSWLPAVMKCTS